MPEIKLYCLLALSPPFLTLLTEAVALCKLHFSSTCWLPADSADWSNRWGCDGRKRRMGHAFVPFVVPISTPQQWPLMLEALGLVPAFLWHSWNHPHWQRSTLEDPPSELLSYWHQLGSTPSSQVWGPIPQSPCSTILYSDNCSLFTFSLKTSRRKLLPDVIISASPWGSLCLSISWMPI